jgi:hypothetical protein
MILKAYNRNYYGIRDIIDQSFMFGIILNICMSQRRNMILI